MKRTFPSAAAAIDRRTILKGLGVALALPWLESLAPRKTRAQALADGAAIKRYVMLYFPNGTADFWHPSGEGDGDAWKLSPILEPLAPVKEYVSVLGNISNYAPFGGHVEPSHSNCGASTWTCVKPSGDGSNDNGISIDQVIANQIGSNTALPSLQVGLSTLDSSTDGLPGQHSRSMSWKSATEPLYKLVNPQAVFDRLVAGVGTNMNDPKAVAAAAHRRALQRSALDYVQDSATSLQKKLSSSDRARLDEFLTATRSLEKRVAEPGMNMSDMMCMTGARPPDAYSVGNVPQGYNRGMHATIMSDLVTMAIRCDLTRVVSFMLDDCRSDFVYDFINERKFTADGSTEGTSPVAGYHGLQHAGDTNDGFATIGWWMAQQASNLAQKLKAIDEGEAGNALDNTVITFASGMHSGNHDALDIPIALIGGGGKLASGGHVLKLNRHTTFGGSEQRLADVHLTIMQKVFGCTQSSFGASAGIMADLLA